VLSYADEVMPGASEPTPAPEEVSLPASSISPPSSPDTDQSYYDPIVEAPTPAPVVTELVPVPEEDSFPVRLLRRKPFPFLHLVVKPYVVNVVGLKRSGLSESLSRYQRKFSLLLGLHPDYNADQERMRLQGRMERMVEEISAGRMLEHSRLSEDLLIGSMAFVFRV
jgi:hypothetical protein